MHTNDGRQSSVVPIGIAQRCACIVNLLGIQQPLQNGLVGLEDGAVLVQLRYADLVADILEGHEILREVCTEVLQFVAVVINQPTICYLHRSRTFHHFACKRLRGFAPRTVWRLGVSHLDVALWSGVVFQYHHIVLLASLDQCGVYAREPWVNHQFGWCKRLKVFCRGIVKPVIVLVLLLPIRESAWNARCPDDDGLLLDVVPEEFGGPDIDRRRVAHHLDETLLTPVYQVFRTGIAEASVASPTGRPHQMEHAVGRTDDAGVAHHLLLADFRA